MSDIAFIVCRLGDDPSPERRWADSVYRHVIEPALKGREVGPHRSDKVTTPGVISAQIVKMIIGARVVICDMTGKNPNVYYELAIAHAFGIPAVLLVDDPKNLAFDINHHRSIVLGPSDAALSADHAESARKALGAVLDEVLVDGYRPTSVVSDAANAVAVADLASDDPAAQELTEMREGLQSLAREVRNFVSHSSPAMQSVARGAASGYGGDSGAGSNPAPHGPWKALTQGGTIDLRLSGHAGGTRVVAQRGVEEVAFQAPSDVTVDEVLAMAERRLTELEDIPF